MNPDWAAKWLGEGSKELSDSALYHLEADAIDGPYYTSSATPVVPGSAHGLWSVVMMDAGL